MSVPIGIAIILSGMAVLFGMVYFFFKEIGKTVKSDNVEIQAQDEAEHQPPPLEDGKWKIVEPTVK